MNAFCEKHGWHDCPTSGCPDCRDKDVDLLATNDAMVWAVEFVKTAKKNSWTINDIDEGLMVGWFANAMAAQEFVGSKKN